MEVPSPAGEFKEACFETIGANEYEDCYLRPVIYRGLDAPGVSRSCAVDVMIAVWKWGKYLGPEAARARASTSASLLEPHGAEHVSGDGEGHRQLPELDPDQDGGRHRTVSSEGIALDNASRYVSEGSGENIFLV